MQDKAACRGARVPLGTWLTSEEAAHAYDYAALAYWRNDAVLNARFLLDVAVLRLCVLEHLPGNFVAYATSWCVECCTLPLCCILAHPAPQHLQWCPETHACFQHSLPLQHGVHCIKRGLTLCDSSAVIIEGGSVSECYHCYKRAVLRMPAVLD